MDTLSVIPRLGVELYSNGAKVSSRHVAEVFGKRHDNVLRAIENLECSKEFNQLNFEGVTYTDAKGESRPEFLMTRDGFTILAMGFTGKEAMAFKEAYIRRFNEYEQIIQSIANERLAIAMAGVKMAIKKKRGINPDPTTVQEKVAEVLQLAKYPLSIRDITRKTKFRSADIRQVVDGWVASGIIVPAVQPEKVERGRPTSERYTWGV